MSSEPGPYDHYRPTDRDEFEPGVYRVVGTREDAVTLLYVADGDGRRVNTGRVVRVTREAFETTFADAENPDSGFRPGQVLDWFASTLRMALDRVR